MVEFIRTIALWLKHGKNGGIAGAPGETRTPDLRFRKPQAVCRRWRKTAILSAPRSGFVPPRPAISRLSGARCTTEHWLPTMARAPQLGVPAIPSRKGPAMDADPHSISPHRVQLRRTKDPRPKSARLCYGCHSTRAAHGQNGFCSAGCRFDARVEVAGSCLVWSGARHNSKGYGRFDDSGLRFLAHRWSYERARGPIPAGFEVDHLCQNTRCVNPVHLEAVTNAEHIRRTDQGARNRSRTHCPRGHPYLGDNLRTDKTGRRHCRACGRERAR